MQSFVDSDLSSGTDLLESDDFFSEGSVSIFQRRGEPKAVRQVWHYAYRSHGLDHLNLDEFIMCTNIVKKPENKSSSTRRTITNRYYELLPPHPLSETHAIHLTTTHYVPTLAGKPPP